MYKVVKNCSYLLWAHFMCGMHEVSTYHGECNAVSVLGRKFHTLFKLMLKYCCVKAVKERNESS